MHQFNDVIGSIILEVVNNFTEEKKVDKACVNVKNVIPEWDHRTI